ncbi:MAG: hypothetical protein Q9212_003473 [Teloschistes hypoglaucus]
MRVRYPFAGAFAVLLLLAGYLRISSTQIPQVNPRILHVICFFLLTLTFYWILDTSRRRSLNFTLLVVTCLLGLGSEALQIVFPNGRPFDPVNIAANVLGSLSALAPCTIYHKRMLDRRRRRKGYGIVPQDGEGEDVELGETTVQQTGALDTGDDWDEVYGGSSTDGESRMTPSSVNTGEDGNAKKQ